MRPPTLGGQLRAPQAIGITVSKMTLHHPQGKNKSTCVTVLLCHSPKQHFCLWPLCLDPHTASLLISCFYLYQNYFPLKNYSYLLSGSPLLVLKKIIQFFYKASQKCNNLPRNCNYKQLYNPHNYVPWNPHLSLPCQSAYLSSLGPRNCLAQW